MLAGSSVSGRLLPRYFREHEIKLANLGLDGSGTAFALDVIGRRADPPRMVLLETYSLFAAPTPNDEVLRQAIEDPSFRFSRFITPMRAESRPSSFLYSIMKRRSDRAASLRSATAVTPSTTPLVSAADDDVALPDNFSSSRDRLRSFQSPGCSLFLLRLPTGQNPSPRPRDAADLLSEETGIPLIDATAAGIVPSYTDGLHLTSKAAAEVSAFIATRLKQP